VINIRDWNSTSLTTNPEGTIIVSPELVAFSNLTVTILAGFIAPIF